MDTREGLQLTVNKDEFVCCRKVSHKEYDIFQSKRVDFLVR